MIKKEKKRRKGKKMTKAMQIFEELLRPRLKIEILWGAEHIILKDDKPHKGQPGEIKAISVVDFVELFQDPILRREVSAKELKQYSKEKGLGWESIIDDFLSKALY